MISQFADTQALQKNLVAYLMAVIGAPDDEEIARSTYEASRAQDAARVASETHFAKP